MRRHLSTMLAMALVMALLQYSAPTVALGEGETDVTEAALPSAIQAPEAEEAPTEPTAEEAAAEAAASEEPAADELAPVEEPTEETEAVPEEAELAEDSAPAEAAEPAPEEELEPLADEEQPQAEEPVLEAQESVDGFISYNLEGENDVNAETFTAPLTGYYSYANSEGSGINVTLSTEDHQVLGSLFLYSGEASDGSYLYLEQGVTYILTFTTNSSEGAVGALSLTREYTDESEHFVIEGGVLTGYTGCVMNLHIPEGVTSVSDSGIEAIAKSNAYTDSQGYTAYHFNEMSLTFPSTLSEISARGLNYCSSIKSAVGAVSFFVSEDNPTFASLDGVLYSKDQSLLVAVPVLRSGAFTVPEGVTEIGAYAFAYGNVSRVTLPNTLVTIGESAFENASITEITLPDSVRAVENRAFAYVGWMGSSNLESIDLGNGVERIGMYAFSGALEDELVLPKSLLELDSYAFEDCSRLLSVTVQGPTELSYGVFSDCHNLQTVTFEDAAYVSEPFDGCYNLEKLVINGDVDLLHSSFEGCDRLKSIELGPNVTNLRFENFGYIQSVYDEEDGTYRDVFVLFPAMDEPLDLFIPDSVTEVTDHALTNVRSISSLTIGKNCTELGSAIQHNLQTIRAAEGNPEFFVRDGVLLARHFLYYNGIENVYSDTTFDLVRFPMDSARTEYVVPDDVALIREDCFANYSAETPRTLTHVTIPYATEVTSGAFWSNYQDEVTLTITSYDDAECRAYYDRYGEEAHLAWDGLPSRNVEVYFDPNGGEGERILCTWRGEPLGRLEVPTRSGYQFLGWFTDPTGGEQITSETPATDTTYYAHWKQNVSYKVTFNANGGTCSKASVTVVSGNKIGTLPTPTRSGYRFLGWYTAKSGGTKIAASTIIGKTQTVYAHWRKRVSLTDAKITVAAATYTGSALKPKVTVKVGTKTLVSGTDFKVTYANNTNVSTKATATITGINNYMGYKRVTFTIRARSVAGLTSKLTKTSYAWTGKALRPGTTVTYGTKKLVKGTDYTVTYKNNTNIGTATVTIKGTGNYTGTKALTFKITKAAQPAKLSTTSISKKIADFSGKSSASYTIKITGAKESPAITVKSSNTSVAKVTKVTGGYRVTVYKRAGSANVTFTMPATTHYKAKTLTLKVSVTKS